MSGRQSRTLLILVLSAASGLAPSHALQQCSCPSGIGAIVWGDRTRPFHTKLPVNQPYLDKIAAPPEVAVLTPVFEQLAQAEREGKLSPLRPEPVQRPQWSCLLHNADPRDVRSCGQRMLEALRSVQSSTVPCPQVAGGDARAPRLRPYPRGARCPPCACD